MPSSQVVFQKHTAILSDVPFRDGDQCFFAGPPLATISSFLQPQKPLSKMLVFFMWCSILVYFPGSSHKRQKPQAPAPQARNCQTRKVANAKVHNRYTNLT